MLILIGSNASDAMAVSVNLSRSVREAERRDNAVNNPLIKPGCGKSRAMNAGISSEYQSHILFNSISFIALGIVAPGNCQRIVAENNLWLLIILLPIYRKLSK